MELPYFDKIFQLGVQLASAANNLGVLGILPEHGFQPNEQFWMLLLPQDKVWLKPYWTPIMCGRVSLLFQN